MTSYEFFCVYTKKSSLKPIYSNKNKEQNTKMIYKID